MSSKEMLHASLAKVSFPLPASLAMGCLCLTGAPAAASCSLTAPVTWSAPGNGNWSAGSDWSGGIVPNGSSTNVCITNGASTVTLEVNASVGDPQLGLGNTLTTAVPGRVEASQRGDAQARKGRGR